MKEKYIDDIKEIKDIMNRSSRFISLSGLSGISAGIFALMLSTFLIGYFSAWGLLKRKYQRMLKKVSRKVSVASLSARKW